MKAVLALLFVLMVNILFFFAQLGMADVNPDAPQLMNYNGSHIQGYDKGNYTLIEFSADELPEPEAQVNTEGNFFTDIFSSMKNWFLDLPGVSHVVGIVNAVPNFLKAIGLPIEVSYALGYLWHALSVFLVVMFIKS